MQLLFSFINKLSKCANTTKARIPLLLLIAFSLLNTVAHAQGLSREELAAIKVSAEGNFKYWNPEAPALVRLKQFVEKTTLEGSESYIPVSNRIAVFDMDGTLISETTPYYTGEMLMLHTVYNDKTWTPSTGCIEMANKINDYLYNNVPFDRDYEEDCAHYKAERFCGMTIKETHDYMQQWMFNTPAEGMSNLLVGSAFYLPMLEVISYLQSNGFTVFICSASDRFFARNTVEGVINIPPYQIIGSGITLVGDKIGDADPRTTNMQQDEVVVRGDAGVVTGKMNKVYAIATEIGQQPVLAFGNSTGDYSMFRYTTENNPYPSEAFCLLCDDTTRDYGNPTKANSVKSACQEGGWNTVSMRDDWKTIYGYSVTKTTSAVKSASLTPSSSKAYRVDGIIATSGNKHQIVIQDAKKTIK